MDSEEGDIQSAKSAKVMANADRHFSRRERESRLLVKRSEDYQVMDGVFDVPTLMAINDLIDSGVIKSVKSHFASGKESKVYIADSAEGGIIALKVYLTVSAEFKKRMQYIAGDPRFENVKLGSTRNLISVWARKEFHNLQLAYNSGIAVPKPIAVKKNVLVMAFVSDAEGNAAPKLSESDVTELDYQNVIALIGTLYRKAGLVHADLSEYNIFRLAPGRLVLFDFGSAVTTGHPLSKQFLARDIVNVNKFFEKRNIDIIEEAALIESIAGA